MVKVDPVHLLMIALHNHRRADGTPSFAWADGEPCETATDVLCRAVGHLLLLTDGKL